MPDNILSNTQIRYGHEVPSAIQMHESQLLIRDGVPVNDIVGRHQDAITKEKMSSAGNRTPCIGTPVPMEYWDGSSFHSLGSCTSS